MGGVGGVGGQGRMGGMDVNDGTRGGNDCPGSTALMLSSEEGHTGAIALLIERGADVNQVRVLWYYKQPIHTFKQPINTLV